MVRPSCCDKIDIRKGSWNEEKDAQMIAFVTKQPASNTWHVGGPRKSGLRRCAKSCRLKKTNVTRNDNTMHENFTPHEEELIIKLHSAIGSRWPVIAQQLPGRTDNDVKNYWNSKLKKKLSSMGIDPVTHRPFSQMLADYGNISGLTRTKTRMGSLGRSDNKNTFFITTQETQQLSTEQLFPSFNNNVKMEPSETIKTDSLDLLAQLQAITHGKDPSTNHEITFTQFHALVPPSSSSSSSSACSTLNEMNPQQAFNWRDFLVENGGNDEKLNFELFTGNNTSSMDGVAEAMEDACDGSFVEAMLDGDDMFLNFPGLLGEQSYQ
ncbi:hypothetical protein R6Q59_010333 [Mikania micrantha]|uniref:Uncharacterized protein n=1 Tax=Mikania micrantha TaxID=192012 RepID=A0A5N6N5U9_9ASTR|nr:hypothetical protein E3N88_25773 [Mikania micrantha]